MIYKEIGFAVDDQVAVITLNRPEAMNAFTGLMGQEWSDAYQRCDADDAIKVVVVTGAGKAFCAGADMSGGEQTFDTKEDMSFSSCPVMPAWQVRKPVIAAMNGHAVGVGFSLALQCDLRIIAEEGKYGLLQVRRGVLADGCSHLLLPRLIGLEKALDLHLTGRRMTGAEAFQLGLASQCVPAAQTLDVAMELARDMASHCAPLVMGIAKKLVWQSDRTDLQQMEKLETRLLHHTMGKADAIEGGIAFIERRLPVWQSAVNDEWPDKF